MNNNLGSGAGTVFIWIDRWSKESERTALVNTLMQKGPAALLDELQKQRAVGTIRTPDSLGYDQTNLQAIPCKPTTKTHRID